MATTGISSGPDDSAAALRSHFLGWQCRIRQLAIRHADGRPTAGMRPLASLEDGGDLGRITVLIVKARSEAITAQFRHMARKTQDPAERLDSVLKFLAAAYYQHPMEFSDEPTALFGPVSELADRLLTGGRCRLDFEQYNQRYALACEPRLLPEDDPAFQATFWHNGLFNPALPAGAAAHDALALTDAQVESERDAFRSRLVALAVTAVDRGVCDKDEFTEIGELVGLTESQREALLAPAVMTSNKRQTVT